MRRLVVVLGVVLAGCSPARPVADPSPPPALGPDEALERALEAELFELEAVLARTPPDALPDAKLSDRRLLLVAALSDLRRRRREGLPLLERDDLLRVVTDRLARAETEREASERPRARVISLDEIMIEGKEDRDWAPGPAAAEAFEGEEQRSGAGPWGAAKPSEAPPKKRPDGDALAEKDKGGAKGPPKAAMVQDAGSSVPPEVQRALDEQMARVGPCLPPNERRRITVRAQWFGERLRGIELASDPPLVPAATACLVEVLGGMRLPSSEGASRVLVFPLATQ